MAGKGNEIGITFEEISKIIEKVKNKDLVGVCFDTCHT
jgi:deoxyribonuclease-4